MIEIEPDISRASTIEGRFYSSDTDFNDVLELVFQRSWQFISDLAGKQRERVRYCQWY